MNQEQIAKLVAETVASVLGGASFDTEPRYIIYIGKKPHNVKAPYIAINADGQLSGFTSEDDVKGTGTDRIGKWTKAEIEELFPHFNHPYFLVEVA